MVNRSGHPADASIVAFAEGETPFDDVRAHVARCALCAARVNELRATRSLLRSTSPEAWKPSRAPAQAAMRQLRAREAAVHGVNEIFAVLRSLMRGMNALFGGRDGASENGVHGSTENRPPNG